MESFLGASVGANRLEKRSGFAAEAKMFDLTGQQVLLRIAAVIVIAATHGVFVAGLAILMGDRGPRYDGRLSLNPGKHIEFIGALTMTVFRIGWIKPVAIDLNELRNRTVGVIVIVFGSLALTIGLAEILWLLRPTLITSFEDTNVVRTFGLWIDTFATMTIWFAVLNLIPIPPFTGGLFLALVSPRLHQMMMERLIVVAIVLAVLVFAGAAAGVFDPVVDSVRDALLR